MKLSNYLRPTQSAKEELLNTGADSIIKSFVQDIKDNKNHPPVIVADYKKRLLRFDKSWKKDVSKKILKGRRCKHLMLQSVAQYYIDDFVKTNYDYTIHHKPGSFVYMNYTKEKFVELSKLEIAMLLYKYGDDLIEFEVKIAITELLTYYFELCNCNVVTGDEIWQWRFLPEELDSCLNYLLNTPLQEYVKYSHYFTTDFKLEKHYRPVEIEYDTKVRPKSKEELLSHFREGMTQNQFDIIIAEYWGVSERTARKWRKEFGITRLYVKKGNQVPDEINGSEESHKIVEEYDNVIALLKQEMNEKDTVIESLEDTIRKQEDEIKKLKVTPYDPEWLKEKNRVLSINNEMLIKENNALKEKLAEINNSTNGQSSRPF